MKMQLSLLVLGLVLIGGAAGQYYQIEPPEFSDLLHFSEWHMNNVPAQAVVWANATAEAEPDFPVTSFWSFTMAGTTGVATTLNEPPYITNPDPFSSLGVTTYALSANGNPQSGWAEDKSAAGDLIPDVEKKMDNVAAAYTSSAGLTKPIIIGESLATYDDDFPIVYTDPIGVTATGYRNAYTSVDTGADAFTNVWSSSSDAFLHIISMAN